MQNTPPQPRLRRRQSIPPQSPISARLPTKKHSRKFKFWSLVGGILAVMATLAAILQFAGIANVPAGIALVESLIYHSTSTPVIRPSTKFPPIGTTLNTYRGSKGAVDTVSWSPNEQLIAFGGSGGTVQVWNPTTNRIIITYRGQKGRVTALAWSPDGTRVASGSADGTVQVWLADSGIPVHSSYQYNKPVTVVAWSPDGNLIAIGYGNGSVGIFWATDNEYNFPFPKMIEPSTDSGAVSTIVWSSDSKLAAVASYPIMVHVYDVYRTSLDGSTHVVSTFNIEGYSKTSGMLGSGVIALSLSPDRKRLASSFYPPAGSTVLLGVWDDTKVLKNIGMFDNEYQLFNAGSQWVETMSWACDSYHLAVGDSVDEVNLYNIATKKLEFRYTNHASMITTVAWSPDGTRIASASEDGMVRIWQASENSLCPTT